MVVIYNCGVQFSWKQCTGRHPDFKMRKHLYKHLPMSDGGPLVCSLVTLFSTNFSTITKEATAITSDVITIIKEVITITREVATIKFWILGMTNQGENGSSLQTPC